MGENVTNIIFVCHGKNKGLSKSYSSIIDQYSVVKCSSVTNVPFYWFSYENIDLEGSDQLTAACIACTTGKQQLQR